MAPISGGWSAGYLVEDKISHLLELYFPQIGPRPHSKKGIFRLIFKLISLSCRQLKRERLKLLEGWIWFKYRLLWKRLSLSWDRKKGFGQLPQVNNWRDSCLFPPCPTLLARIEICNFPFCGKQESTACPVSANSTFPAELLLDFAEHYFSRGVKLLPPNFLQFSCRCNCNWRHSTSSRY